ncbi:gas vesicle protein GvpG [Nocardia sp. NPDC051787]|uniref:gas vesicle protein GvpG n=1 Tax=Nocardia sp. NPDC051787 TaxID=3155415 RepID=UPI003422FA90
MGLLTSIFTLPIAPVRGVIWLSEVIQDQVEQKLRDPAAIRRRIEAIDEAAAAGHLSEEEREQAQQAVLDPLIQPPTGTTPTEEKE